MSRPIKFRAWLKPRWDDDDDANKMYYDVQNSYDTLGNVKPYDPMNSFDHWLDDEVAIVEQYTGLTDKNGKEIYEGDIIKIEGSDTVYTVEYGRGIWVARFGDESGDNICLYHYVQKDIVLYAEVIGNIHEPPKDFRPEHLKRMGVSISKGGEE